MATKSQRAYLGLIGKLLRIRVERTVGGEAAKRHVTPSLWSSAGIQGDALQGDRLPASLLIKINVISLYDFCSGGVTISRDWRQTSDRRGITGAERGHGRDR
jgi:hypothetical protein